MPCVSPSLFPTLTSHIPHQIKASEIHSTRQKKRKEKETLTTRRTSPRIRENHHPTRTLLEQLLHRHTNPLMRLDRSTKIIEIADLAAFAEFLGGGFFGSAVRGRNRRWCCGCS